MLTLKQFLKSEVVPAYGCTEPGAVALGVARAYQELKSRSHALHPNDVNLVLVEVSDSIYKNGLNVGIPGTGGARGNAIAAALGILCGEPERGLEVLHASTPKLAKEADSWVKTGRVKVIRNSYGAGVYIKAIVKAGGHEATSLIQYEHANITKIEYDGETVFDNTIDESHETKEESVLEILKERDYRQSLILLDEMDEEDESYLLHGADLCKTIAEYGIKHKLSAFGSNMKDESLFSMLAVDSDNIICKIRKHCEAAAVARMAGAPLPVMSSAGSGNHGITAILPVVLLGEYMKKSDKDIARALAISHLSTSFIKSRLGKLSPVCGCVVAAGPGAAAGMVSLLGGDMEKAASAMIMVIAATIGMICDGGKESCSLKVGIGSQEACFAAVYAIQGGKIDKFQGIVGSSLEQTVENMGLLSDRGMADMDSVILEILDQQN